MCSFVHGYLYILPLNPFLLALPVWGVTDDPPVLRERPVLGLKLAGVVLKKNKKTKNCSFFPIKDKINPCYPQYFFVSCFSFKSP